jgi:hypothetical protein
MDTEKLARVLDGLNADETLYVLKNGAMLAEKGGTCQYVTETAKIDPPRIEGPLTAEELVPLLNQFRELD